MDLIRLGKLSLIVILSVAYPILSLGITNDLGAVNILDFALHFEGGSDGDQITKNIMTNSALISDPFKGTMDIEAGDAGYVPFFLGTTGSQILPSIYQWSVYASNHPPYNLGLSIDMAYANSNSSSLTWLFTSSTISNLVVGFYFRTTLTNLNTPLVRRPLYDVMYIGESALDFPPAQLDEPVALFTISNSWVFWSAHGLSNGVSIESTPCNLPGQLKETDPVWVSMRITPNEYRIATFDTTNWNQIGSDSVMGMSGKGKWRKLLLLSYPRWMQPGRTSYVDNVLISTNLIDWPLVPYPLAMSSVSNAIGQSSSGDTILLPTGTANWDQTLLWSNKPIAIFGSGYNSTIITNIQDGAIGSDEKELMTIYATTNGITRLSRVGLHGNSTNNILLVLPVDNNKYPVVRIDHCSFEKGRFTTTCSFEGLFASVVDHCIFINNQVPYSCYAKLPWETDSWSDDLSLGSTNSVVVEDCYFVNNESFWGGSTSLIAQGRGCRNTFRYNIWTNTFNQNFLPIIDAHGNGNYGVGDNSRGTRQFECYNNLFVSTSGTDQKLTDLRGGTCLIYNNTFIGASMRTQFSGREEDGFWGIRVAYPGYDQHFLYIWDNNSQGSPTINILETTYVTDPTFIIVNTDLFWSAPSVSTPPITIYTPLTYPHPLISAQDGIVHAQFKGKAKFLGKATIR